MRVFITGAAGYIGSKVVETFVEAGHDVTGMVHHADNAALITDLGATGVTRDLEDIAFLQGQVPDYEVVINLAFQADAEGIEKDRRAVETILETLGAANG